MTPKTIEEAIDQALRVGPMAGIKNRMRNELKEYFSREILKLMCSHEIVTAKDLFNWVFKDVGGKS